MNLIDEQLEKIKKERRLGFMTHVVIGYPSLEKTKSLVKVMAQTGVDFIELQIPFSDPLADGPTIMKACEESLEHGTRVKDAFKLARSLSAQVNIPLLFMAYYNTVFKYGTKLFCQHASAAGVSGLIVPDMPLEEEREEHFIKFCKEAGLKNIRVISPASTAERLDKNARIADGFIYCAARQGITGAQKALDPQISSFLKTVKKHFRIPVAVGFGISDRERIKLVKPFADIVVIGSVLIEIINKSNAEELEENIKDFLSEIKKCKCSLGVIASD